MKQLPMIILLLLATALMGLAAENFQETFDRAGGLYQQAQFSEALELYRQLEDRVSSWKLYYNMGNCFYKLNRVLEAKIYYLKARKIKPLQSSILKNILVVNKLFKDKIPDRKIHFWEKVLLKVESIISLNFISVLLVLLVVMFNLSLFVLVKRGKNKWALYGLFFFLILSVFISMAHIYRVQKQNMQNMAVVVRDDARLRSGPGSDNTVLFKVNPGLEVKIIESSGRWLQVSASDDIAGWIEKDRLAMI